MGSRKVVIVGCGLAGTTAAEAARKQDRSASITVVESTPHHEYSRCGLPYVVSGDVQPPSSLFLNKKAYYQDSLKVSLSLGTSLEEIDVEGMALRVRGEGGSEPIPYDSLVLATGASAVDLPIPGFGKAGVVKLRTLEDADAISRAATSGGRAIVIGAGLIGLEVADSLVAKGMKVTVVEMLPEVLPTVFDGSVAARVRERLSAKGVSFLLGKKVSSVVGFDRAEGADVDGEVIKAELVVASAGIRPRTEQARKAGIKVGRYGGIVVDEASRTSVPSIYAAGDCVELANRLISESRPIQLATVALRTGEVAGANAAGGSMRLPNLFGNTSSKIAGLEVSATGLSETDAKAHGIQTSVAESSSYEYAPYFPGGGSLFCKLVADQSSGTLVGAQFLGAGAAGWGNLATLMIAQGLHVSALAYLETNFSPPVQNFWPAPVVAARRLARTLATRRVSV
ncbi:MAG TPA: FAD-dependent oxidoreductase [Conexivisphaerales archaeon]|nr:FAD-dependent oxidoreductase [Conexivisphaerales archaeon]